jgi:hypothetical protein
MDRQYVGIDFHRRRSVIVRLDGAGQRLSVHRIANDAFELSLVMAEAGECPCVVIEATYGWYWAVDLLQELGATVYLANPKALNWGDRRVKNDVIDATDLADMLRLGRLPEAWIAPPAIRELRELVRYRAKLVQLRSGLKAQVHAVMAKQGVLPRTDDMFGPGGNRQLDEMDLDRNYAIRVQSLRDLIGGYDREIVMLERDIHAHLKGDPGYQAVQAIKGVGRTIAAILVAEIGDVSRFPTRPICVRGPADPPSSRVGHQNATGSHLQARVSAVALGAHRSDQLLPRRRDPVVAVSQDRQTTRTEQGPCRGRAQGPHARLLRATRRRDPLSRTRNGGCVRLGHGPVASSTIGMTPARPAASRRTD